MTPDSSTNLPQSTILVVDDRAEIRRALRMMLERSGYDVALARNGREALDQYQTLQPDIMILDMFMPVMNGFDTLFILKQEHPDAKVIAVSGGGGNMGADALIEASNLGAQITLQKPFGPRQLLQAVATLLAA